MKRFILFFLSITISIAIYSQEINISGYVYAKKSGESVLGANIYILNSKNKTRTNDFGYFSLAVSAQDSVNLIINHIKFGTKIIKVSAEHDTMINIYLSVKDYQIENVVVKGNKYRQEISTNDVSIKIAKILPSIAGENDIMKIYTLMPGVQSAENKSALMVRGGSDDQNLIILDDVPLYYLNHLGGFVSVFNTDALKDAKLIKGGFPAHYGNRLSSVLDVRMKDGNMKKYIKHLSIGLLSTNFSIEGPIEKNISSFIISARRFNLDLISRPITYFTNKMQAGYYFYDLNLKLNRKFNDKNRLFFSFYSGDDKTFIIFKQKDIAFFNKDKSLAKQESSWGNLLFALRFNHIFNSNFFSNTTLSYTRYRNENSLNFKEYENGKTISNNKVSFYSGIKDFRLNTDFQLFISKYYKLRAGGNVILHFYSPGKNSFLMKQADSTIIDTAFNDIKLIGLEANAYIENKIFIGNFKANLGLRINYFYIKNTGFPSLEPRLNLSYKFPYDFYLTSSFSQMQQNIHLISFASSSLPLKIWIPASKDEMPEKSNQFTLGLNKNFYKKYSFDIEAYYKTMNNLIDMKSQSILFNPSQNYKNFIVKNGKGTCYGLEFFVQKYIGKFQGWISYSYSKSLRQFTEINHGKIYPFDFDRRHSISVVGAYRISKNISVSADWVYGSGFPFTLVNQKYFGFRSFSEKNNMRMLNFHKLDISLKLSRERKNKFIRTWSFDIYNVYNRQNASYYVIKQEEINNTFEDKLYKVTLFPIIPSVSYSLKF